MDERVGLYVFTVSLFHQLFHWSCLALCLPTSLILSQTWQALVWVSTPSVNQLPAFFKLCKTLHLRQTANWTMGTKKGESKGLSNSVQVRVAFYFMIHLGDGIVKAGDSHSSYFTDNTSHKQASYFAIFFFLQFALLFHTYGGCLNLRRLYWP